MIQKNEGFFSISLTKKIYNKDVLEKACSGFGDSAKLEETTDSFNVRILSDNENDALHYLNYAFSLLKRK